MCSINKKLLFYKQIYNRQNSWLKKYYFQLKNLNFIEITKNLWPVKTKKYV